MKGAWGGRFPRALLGIALAVLVAGCGRFEARRELRKGNGFYRDKEYPEAIACFDRVAKDVPERVHADLRIGYSYMAQYAWGGLNTTDPEKQKKNRDLAASAVAAFDGYLKRRPADVPEKELPGEAEIENRIISLLIDSQRYEQAVSRLKEKLARDAKNPAVINGLASAYEKWGKPVVVLAYRQRYAALYPADPSPLAGIAALCWNLSYRQSGDMTPLERNRWIDTGLAAARSALTIDANSVDGLTYKNLLLRERAKLRNDPDEVAALVREATQILIRVNEMRKKQKEAEAARAKTGSPSPTPGSRT